MAKKEEGISAVIHECETPSAGLIQHKWTCPICGVIWEIVGFDERANPEWETFGEQL